MLKSLLETVWSEVRYFGIGFWAGLRDFAIDLWRIYTCQKWSFDKSTDTMSRRVNGVWEIRRATPHEIEEHLRAEIW